MICFASVTGNVRITRWRIGGLFATNTRQSVTAGYSVCVAGAFGLHGQNMLSKRPTTTGKNDYLTNKKVTRV